MTNLERTRRRRRRARVEADRARLNDNGQTVSERRHPAHRGFMRRLEVDVMLLIVSTNEAKADELGDRDLIAVAAAMGADKAELYRG
jgi:hypothetical protein